MEIVARERAWDLKKGVLGYRVSVDERTNDGVRKADRLPDQNDRGPVTDDALFV
jgi:hypothetical protein